MKKLCLWLRAIRAPLFTAAAIPTLVGGALAAHGGHFSGWAVFLSFIIIACNQAGANLLNDFCDAEGSDACNCKITPFSGGSRVIQEGRLSAAKMLKGAFIGYGLALGIALWVSVWMNNILILGLTAGGTVLGIGYSLAPFYGMGRGVGELMVGITFGPMAVMGSYLLQTGILRSEAFWAGVPVGLFIMGVLIVNELPDLEADRVVGKRNLMVRLGWKRGVWIYLAGIGLGYLTIFIGVWRGIFPVGILFSYTTIPLAICIFLKLRRYPGQVTEIIPAMACNIGLHFLTGLLLCIGLW